MVEGAAGADCACGVWGVESRPAGAAGDGGFCLPAADGAQAMRGVWRRGEGSEWGHGGLGASLSSRGLWQLPTYLTPTVPSRYKVYVWCEGMALKARRGQELKSSP